MNLREKGYLAIGLILAAGLFAFLVRVESPSSSLGAASLNNPAYVVTSTSVTATTTIFTFAGVLHTISVTKPVAGSVITIYDSATTSTATIAPVVITLPASTSTVPFTLTIDGIFNNGVTITNSGTSTVTLTYQQN